MSEDILSDINQDLVPEGNDDYWETFRDHFAFSVANYQWISRTATKVDC